MKKRCSSTSVDIRLMTGKQNNANYLEEATFFNLIFSLHKSTKKKNKKRRSQEHWQRLVKPASQDSMQIYDKDITNNGVEYKQYVFAFSG
jgi:hypothetical protein